MDMRDEWRPLGTDDSWQYHAKMSRGWQDRRREFNIKLDFREMKLEITGSRRGPVGLRDPTSSPITTRINNGSQYGIVPILNYECLPLQTTLGFQPTLA
jgi:hypothetical protein